MTRNTKFYKTKGSDIYYRDLTTVEYNVLMNIKNAVIRNEMAGTIAINNKDPKDVPFETKVQIGEDIIYRTSRIIDDPALVDVYVGQFRDTIKKGDPIVTWISHITKVFPGTSVVDLLNLTAKDLIELVVLCEEIIGNKIFGSKQKKMNFVNPANLDDAGKKALRDQIRNLNNDIGIK